MEIADSVEIAATPHAVEAALHDAEVLAAILPACSSVECLSPGHFRARVERKLGLLTLRLEPDLVLTRQPGGLGMSIRAANRVAGSLTADLSLVLDRSPTGTALAYRGTVETSGLAARLLAERQGDMAGRIRAMFLDLKARLESP